jgi:hypothetical protein
MASYTYNTVPFREAGLLAVVAELNEKETAENDRLAALDPPQPAKPLTTKEQYWTARNDEFLDSYARQHQNKIAELALSKYGTLSDTEKTNVLNILGLGDLKTLSPETQAKILGVIGVQNFLALPHDQMNAVFTALGIGV